MKLEKLGTQRRTTQHGGRSYLTTAPETLQDAAGTNRDVMDRVSARYETVSQFYERFDHLCIRCHFSGGRGARTICPALASLEEALFRTGDDQAALDILKTPCNYRPASNRLMRQWDDHMEKRRKAS